MQHISSYKICAVIAASLVLTGCVGNGDKYPSLAIRDAERVAGTFTPVAETPAPPPTDPALLVGLPAIEARADNANQAFQNAVPGTERALAAARGRSPTSNQWGAAQIALADLDSHRSQTAIALADIDLLYAEASNELTLNQEIAELRGKIGLQISAQDQVLGELQKMAR